ncbi:MAG: hypothetical protein FJ217_08035 [Ignavibacteria bacterium]|nr:hypothetical protein [Ignavibacteria bacterium]
MNTGQTLLTIIAIVLLGSNVVSINRTFTQHGVVLQHTEIGIFGVSLAMSILEEAQGKAFDHVTADSFATSLNELSSSLGAEGGESSRHFFNDFDDYNGWRDTVTIDGVDTFYRWARVVYVDTSNINGFSSSRTWHKKLSVNVKGSNAQDTLQMQYIFSYWSFR